MMSSSKDGTLKIWDLREGRQLFTMQGHTGPVNCARFSTDGHFFASAGADQMVMIWKSNLYGVDAPEIEWGQGKKPLTSGVINSPNMAAVAAARAASGTSVSSPAPIVSRQQQLHSNNSAIKRFVPQNFTIHRALSITRSNSHCYSPVGDARSRVRTSLGGRPSTAVSSAYAAATTPVSAMAAPRRPLPPHAAPEERRVAVPVPSKASAAQPKTATKVSAKPTAAPSRPAPVAPRPSSAPSTNTASRGHLSATPLVAHSTEHIPAGLAATLEHIVGQLDLITKTMGVMEERLTLTESRVSGMIAAQRATALQQQKAQHPDPAAMDRTEVVNVTHTTTTHTVTGAPFSSAGTTNAAPTTADLRTIQLRVMCRQRGLDALGSEQELLKRLNDAVATNQSSAQPSSASAHEGYLSHSQINHSRFAGEDDEDEESGSEDEDSEQGGRGYAEEVDQSGEGFEYREEVYEEVIEEEVQFYAASDEEEVEEVGQYDSAGEEGEER